jgi:phosphoribosyl 1,2-cyclic phosphodiesterase
LVFLGSGGGRVNLIKQKRKTGGFRINGQVNIHVDPGPGALIYSNLFGQDPMNLDLIVVTHNHIDHVNDASLLIEAMTNFALKKNGGILASKSVVLGDEYKEKCISSYHLSKLSFVKVGEPGKSLSLKIKNKNLDFSFSPVKHEDKSGFGFVLRLDSVSIGYTSDTEYFEDLPNYFRNCDVLIINVIKRKHDGLRGHFTIEEAIEFLNQTKPKKVILTHFGMQLIEFGPEKEAARIEKICGVKTIAAEDGMKIKIKED